jgi:hypothetical protein
VELYSVELEKVGVLCGATCEKFVKMWNSKGL